MPAPDLVLKRLRERNVKPFELQKALDISPSMASRILDGSRGVSLWHLDAVAGLLGMTLSELFDDAVSNEIVRERKVSSSQNKSSHLSKIAQSGSPSVGENTPPVKPEDAVDAAHDRSSQSQAALNAQVRDQIGAIAGRFKLAAMLYAVIENANINLSTVQQVADALRTGGQTPGPRAKVSNGTGGRARVRRNGTGRRRA